MITKVEIAKRALKDLELIPIFLLNKFQTWVESVEKLGIEEIRKIPGYHDEPLKGKRKGQRSIKLNKAYRAIYIIKKDRIEFIEIIEINKHEY